MGLKKTRQQGHTAQSIAPMVKAVRTMHPKAGIQEMISLLRQEHNIMVSSPFSEFMPSGMKRERT